MAFRREREEGEKKSAPPKKESAPATKPVAVVAPLGPDDRLVSVDAYRGLVMLAMASGGLGISNFVDHHPALLTAYEGTRFAKVWEHGWRFAAHQLEHVEWTGCTAWDLIQPSFMFLVGVAMPFSYAKRTAVGDSWLKQLGHAAIRALVLILLGIFLRSRGSSITRFTFEDVLTQIGLGYVFVFLLLNRPYWLQLLAVIAILGGYWFFFFHHPLPPPEGNKVTHYLTEVGHQPPEEWNQFQGLAAHWNKHTNAAAEFDRKFLNLFPRPEPPWEGKKFWVNGGGYQTLNFVPATATMILGLMGGQLLRSLRTTREKLAWLFGAGALCFVISMGIDTTIWPFSIPKVNYTYGPIVKRIWTPTWVLFSSGWTFWILGVFYWIVDMRGFRRLAFPLAIVGMNSIAVYVMAQLMMGWLGSMLKIHLATIDAAAHTKLVGWLYDPNSLASVIVLELAVLGLVWLICLWMYRRRIFVRV